MRRLQAAGAISVVIVNEGWGTFQPKIVTENLASVDAIGVPVQPLPGTLHHEPGAEDPQPETLHPKP